MLRRDQQLRTQIAQLKDALIFMLALWLAHYIRTEWIVLWFPSLLDSKPVEPFQQFAWLYLVLPLGAPLVLESQGFYKRTILASRRLTAWILLKACVLVTVGVILVLFLFKWNLARSVIVLFGVISFGLMMLSEEILLWAHRSKFAQSQLKRRVLLVGSPADTGRMRSELGSKGGDETEVLAEVDLNESTVEHLVRLLHECSANMVILNAKHTYFGQIERAIQACEREGVEACLIADFFQTQISRTGLDDFYGRPVLVFRSVPEASWQGVGKQLMDLALSLLLLVMFSPLLLLLALVIRFSSPGPVLFRQSRCGLNGRPFTMLKFRSMVSDAEQRKHELAALNEMSGPVFKITNDPRITRVGQFMRKYSLDELPQLWNVLRGEMSLVGPRPLPVDEVERFDDPSDRRRLSVKPGLTCLWQVSGRNELRDFKEWVRLDLHYIDHWSLWLDLKILWRTIPIVLTGAGAK
ncbi:MAG: sugar transferase [Verrucomicrobia bacterium]|nr:sugar transferase [Verrucomicrobiota bacterium]